MMPSLCLNMRDACMTAHVSIIVTAKQRFDNKFIMDTGPFLELSCWIASNYTHGVDIFYNDTATINDCTLSNISARRKNEYVGWQPRIVFHHDSIILVFPFGRVDIVRGRYYFCIATIIHFCYSYCSSPKKILSIYSGCKTKSGVK